MADAAQAFCGRWVSNENTPSLLVLVGDSGCGKTHVAKAIYWFCNSASSLAFKGGKWGHEKKPDTKYVAWPATVAAMKQKFDGGFEDALAASLSVLDDVGAENDPWAEGKDKLCQILSRREKMFTVLTTNAAPDSWAQRFDTRIADRLMRNSVIVDLAGVQSYALQ